MSVNSDTTRISGHAMSTQGALLPRRSVNDIVWEPLRGAKRRRLAYRTYTHHPGGVMLLAARKYVQVYKNTDTKSYLAIKQADYPDFYIASMALESELLALSELHSWRTIEVMCFASLVKPLSAVLVSQYVCPWGF